MHQCYGWEAVALLPLSLISKLIIDAKIKETEKMMFPMWLVHIIQATINNTETKTIDEFMDIKQNMNITNKSAEEIKDDILPLIEKYRKRGNKNG